MSCDFGCSQGQKWALSVNLHVHVGHGKINNMASAHVDLFACIFPSFSPLNRSWTKQVQHEYKGLTSYYSFNYVELERIIIR